jgi:hypothetical protein
VQLVENPSREFGFSTFVALTPQFVENPRAASGFSTERALLSRRAARIGEQMTDCIA